MKYLLFIFFLFLSLFLHCEEALAQAQQSDEIMATGKVKPFQASSVVSKRLDENFSHIDNFREILDEDDFNCTTGEFLKNTYAKSIDEAAGKRICETISLLTTKNVEILNSYSEMQFQQDEAQVKRFTRVLNHNTMVYESQRTQTWVIFIITHIVLIIGFLAALLELRKAHQLRSSGNEIREEFKRNVVSRVSTEERSGTVTTPPLNSADIDVTLGFDRIALKTSINGVAIFVITIFYYLIYITFVYPITQAPQKPEIIINSATEQSVAEADEY